MVFQGREISEMERERLRTPLGDCWPWLWEVGFGPGIDRRATAISKHCNIDSLLFLLRDGDEHHMYAANALSAMIHQLLNQTLSGVLIKRILLSHQKYGPGLARNFAELWNILMSYVGSPDADEIICVLDALDECRQEERQQLINKLKEVYNNPRQLSDPQLKLKFLITSRPYGDLEASFSRLSDMITYVRFDGDEKAAQISKEINLVIDEMVDGVAHVFGKDDRRRIAEQLKRIKHRTYPWLHLTFGIVERRPGKYGRRSNVKQYVLHQKDKKWIQFLRGTDTRLSDS